MSKRELAYQNHILDSYSNSGGFGKKWATDMQKGNPDLIVSIPNFGAHLAEVKHLPQFAAMGEINNPMRPKQVDIAKKYLSAGTNVLLFVVSGTQARASKLCAFSPLDEKISFEKCPAKIGYEVSKKFDINWLLHCYSVKYGWK